MRIGTKEQEASVFLRRFFTSNSILFTAQPFNSTTPNFIEYELTADGRSVPCLPSGLRSGRVSTVDTLVSSLTSSQILIDQPNINFNPRTDTICLCNFYFAPSLAVSRASVPLLMAARSVMGYLKVRPQAYKSDNILVGNARSPRAIVFAHYDAYFSGATDNASGVAAALEVIRRYPKLLGTTLFVFAGNEELSYDYPVYWGRGFREFYRMNPGLLEQTEAIYVIDSVGDGAPLVETSEKIAQLAFPIGPYPKLLKKTAIVTGNFDALMNVYHSSDDVPTRLERKYLDATVLLVESLIAK